VRDGSEKAEKGEIDKLRGFHLLGIKGTEAMEVWER
jgi:hypothetical protein